LRSVLDVSITKLAGLWATWALIAFVYCLGRWYWRGQYLFAMDLLETGAVPVPGRHSLCAVARSRAGGAARWRLAFRRDADRARSLCDRPGLAPSARLDGEGLFLRLHDLDPARWLCRGGGGRLVRLWANPVRWSNTAIEAMFMIDVQIAMVGYLLTMKPLDAQIRTANPYLAGWVAALICYPPFVLMGGGGVLDYHQNTAEWAWWMAIRRCCGSGARRKSC
jgi:hypothetical protein